MIFWHLGLTGFVVLFTLGRRRIDYRVVALGAILPDLIDKPIGRVLFENAFETSRLWGHTLVLWLAVMLGIQLVLRGDTARRWFVLPIAAMVHLVLDGMWSDPITLFWPLFGGGFPPMPTDNYWLEALLRPFEYPWEAVKELVGLALTVYLARSFELFDRDNFRRFLRTGEVPADRGRGRAEMR